MSSDESKVNQEELLNELKELKTLIFALDKKVDVNFVELKGELKQINVRMDGEFKCLNGEVKRLEDKFDSWEKRLQNAEFVSKASVTAIFLGFMSGLAKFLFFNN